MRKLLFICAIWVSLSAFGIEADYRFSVRGGWMGVAFMSKTFYNTLTVPTDELKDFSLRGSIISSCKPR